MQQAQDSLALLRFGECDSFFLQKGYMSDQGSSYTTGRSYGQQGVAGVPVPYTLSDDSIVSSVLLLCLVFLIISLSHTYSFLKRQLKYFFQPPTSYRGHTETVGEVRIQMALVVMGCLLFAMTIYQTASIYVSSAYLLEDYQMVFLLFGGALAFSQLRHVLYNIVNRVFFHRSQVSLWNHTVLFLTAMITVLFFPIVLLQVYFDFSMDNTLLSYGIVLFFIEILTFYKCWSIFFRQKGGFLQTFLYLCTLEIVPLLLFAGGIRLLIDSLRYIF